MKKKYENRAAKTSQRKGSRLKSTGSIDSFYLTEVEMCSLSCFGVSARR
jgi:hypothetical protein